MFSVMKIVGYARVSSAKKLAHGVSLEAQIEKIRAMSLQLPLVPYTSYRGH